MKFTYGPFTSEFDHFPPDLAEKVRTIRPDLWARYGNGGRGATRTRFTGNHAYALWRRMLAGERTDAIREWATGRREKFMSRVQNQHSVGWAISAIKWGGALNVGPEEMIDIINSTPMKGHRGTPPQIV